MLGPSASLIGAATLVFERLLDSGNLLDLGRETAGLTPVVRR